MIQAPNSFFSDQEARKTGAWPIVIATLLPFNYKTGVDGSGVFVETVYAAPGRILVNNLGFANGSWYADPLETEVAHYPSPAVLLLDWNMLGLTWTLKWRSAMTPNLLAAAAWQTINPGDSVNLYRWYQWGFTVPGKRCWINDGEAPNDFTFYVVDDPGSSKASVVCDTHYPNDDYGWIAAVQLIGEYAIPYRDIAGRGQLICEAPADFGEIKAGEATLTLMNQQRDEQGRPAPKYSPNKSSFIFAGQDWFRRHLRLEAGYIRPGTDLKVFDKVLLFLGELRKWGPASRAVDQNGNPNPLTMDIYAKDWIAALLDTPIGLPDAAGNPQPLIYGEYQAKAEPLSGKGVGSPFKSWDFEDGRLPEDYQVSGGGTLSLNTATPLSGAQSLRSQTSGANHTALANFGAFLPINEMLALFKWRWTDIPASPVNNNLNPFRILDQNGSILIKFYVNSDGKLVAWINGAETVTDWQIALHQGVRVDVSLWVKCANPGYVCLWVAGQQVLKVDGLNLAAYQIKALQLGLATASTGENWTADIDDVRLWDHYYLNAYQVAGWPFLGISTVYNQKLVQKSTDFTVLPQYGLVQFTKMDNTGKLIEVSGDVSAMVKKNDLYHQADVIQDLVTFAGLSPYVDAVTFAAAKAASPTDRIGCRFENCTVGQAIVEITKRLLLNFHVDHGDIRLIAYQGVPPASAVLLLNESEIRELTPTVDMDQTYEAVVVKWSRYGDNPDLCYTAGIIGAKAQEIDLSYDSPVATESADLAKAKANTWLKRLRLGQELYDPIRTSWRSLRVEMGDGIQVSDQILTDGPLMTEITKKTVNLDKPFEVQLQTERFLGE